MEVFENFSILITTRDRLDVLKETMHSLAYLYNMGTKIIICDDGSLDGTSKWITTNYPNIQLITNIKSKGYIANRNRLLSAVKTLYAISLDDDANFLVENPLPILLSHFEKHSECGLVAFRIFWGIDPPKKNFSNEHFTRVKGFVGCGHAWRMEAWRSIPDYPVWYNFYGEEEFASFHLFKKGWEVHYIPQLTIHHKADLILRKKNKEYSNRLRLSLKAGWNNYFIFYPLHLIPKHFFYSIYMQLKKNILKADFKALSSLFLALTDTSKNILRINNNRAPLSDEEFKSYRKLRDTQFYWNEKL